MRKVDEQLVNTTLGELICQCKGTMSQGDYPTVESLVRQMRLLAEGIDSRLVIAALLFLLIEAEDRLQSETNIVSVQ